MEALDHQSSAASGPLMSTSAQYAVDRSYTCPLAKKPPENPVVLTKYPDCDHVFEESYLRDAIPQVIQGVGMRVSGLERGIPRCCWRFQGGREEDLEYASYLPLSQISREIGAPARGLCIPQERVRQIMNALGNVTLQVAAEEIARARAADEGREPPPERPECILPVEVIPALRELAGCAKLDIEEVFSSIFKVAFSMRRGMSSGSENDRDDANLVLSDTNRLVRDIGKIIERTRKEINKAFREGRLTKDQSNELTDTLAHFEITRLREQLARLQEQAQAQSAHDRAQYQQLLARATQQCEARIQEIEQQYHGNQSQLASRIREIEQQYQGSQSQLASDRDLRARKEKDLGVAQEKLDCHRGAHIGLVIIGSLMLAGGIALMVFPPAGLPVVVAGGLIVGGVGAGVIGGGALLHDRAAEASSSSSARIEMGAKQPALDN